MHVSVRIRRHESGTPASENTARCKKRPKSLGLDAWWPATGWLAGRAWDLGDESIDRSHQHEHAKRAQWTDPDPPNDVRGDDTEHCHQPEHGKPHRVSHRA